MYPVESELGVFTQRQSQLVLSIGYKAYTGSPGNILELFRSLVGIVLTEFPDHTNDASSLPMKQSLVPLPL